MYAWLMCLHVSLKKNCYIHIPRPFFLPSETKYFFEKIAQKEVQSMFCQNLIQIFLWKNFWASTYLLFKNAKVKQSAKRLKFAQSGHPDPTQL
jgi:hypothetical protein